MKRLLGALLVAAAPALAQNPPPAPGPSPPDTWQPRGSVELVMLDKVRAQPTTMQVKVGQTVSFGSLSIVLRNCVARPPDLPADSAAFLDVTDTRAGGAGFHGWMLANTPSVSQMEHPIYDIRVVACR